MGVIVAFTNELMLGSAAETVFSTLLREACAMQLDASVFSNVAATAARPAGILNGVAPLAAAPAGDETAMANDLVKLAAAIGPVTSGLVYVAHPAQASAMKIRRGANFVDVPIWPTISVAAGVVDALDPAAFASAFGAEPQIEASKGDPMLLLDDAPGSNPMAGPTSSLFQSDMVSLKLKLDAAWVWRTAGAVAWIANTTW